MRPRFRKLSAIPMEKHRAGWVILRRGEVDIISLLVSDGGVQWEPQPGQEPLFDGNITIEAIDALATVEWA
jgi:hypothetical protein